MKKGGIEIERMMAGALRADGQRRMIGDTMKKTKTAEMQVRRHAKINPFTWPTHFRAEGPFRLGLASCWLIRTVPFFYYLHSLADQNGRHIYYYYCKFRSTIQCDIQTVAMAQERDLVRILPAQ
jgi:hypothetical protein